MSEVELGIGAVASVTLVSVTTTVVALLVVRRWSDQDEIARLRRVSQAHLLEFRLFQDDPTQILQSQRALIVDQVRLMARLFRPLLILIVPMLFIMWQLDALYGRAPLRVGEAAVISIDSREHGIEAPVRASVETKPVFTQATGQTSWRIRPSHETIRSRENRTVADGESWRAQELRTCQNLVRTEAISSHVSSSHRLWISLACLVCGIIDCQCVHATSEFANGILMRFAILLIGLCPVAFAQSEAYERARRLLADGRPTEAAAIYRDLLRAQPRSADLHLNLSVAEYKAARFREAAASASDALKLAPDLLPANLFLGASYLELGRFKDAVDALRRVVAADPHERNGRLMLAEALAGAGDPNSAIQHFRGRRTTAGEPSSLVWSRHVL